MEDYAIKLNKVSKSFKLPHEKNSTLKGAVVNFAKRGYELQKVFTDLTLTVPKGEFLGILGRNGSGKSTLLKTLSGIYSPDSGKITINGKLTPFIELGVGFNPELSGRDNVYLNGALLGFSRKEIDVIYEEIVSFAELERFMDQKLKNYSSGMQVRLAFSIAIRANTDILVLDEVLAVGDEAFQRKCYDYFNELKLRGKTVILVTHDMSAVTRFCTKAVVIDKGEIIFNGDTEQAADVYRKLNLESTNNAAQKGNKQRLLNTQYLKKGARLSDLRTLNDKEVEKTLFEPNEKFVIQASIEVKKRVDPIKLNIVFNNPGGVPLASFSKIIDSKTLDTAAKEGKKIVVSWNIDGIFNDGKYLVSVILSDENTKDIYSRSIDAHEFNVNGWDEIDYVLHLKPKFTVELV